jgi:hypothetical protein
MRTLTLVPLTGLLWFCTATTDAAAPRARIAGPTGGVPGDILWLDGSSSTGTHFAWKVLPETLNGVPTFYLSPTEPQRCLLASRPGMYTVWLAVANDEGVDLTSWTVSIVSPPGPSPNPSPPTPGPPLPPQPSPPVPQPDIPPDLPDGEFHISRDVRDWAGSVNSATRAAEAHALAEAADNIAAAIAAGSLRSASQILSALLQANNSALGTQVELWKPFGDRYSARLKELYFASRLTTPEHWATLLRETAVGLRAVH